LEAIPGRWLAFAPDKSKHGKPNSDLIRFYRDRPYFLFTYESDVADETLMRRLEEVQEASSLPPLDAVFILSRGVTVNLWDGQGSLGFQTLDGQTRTNWLPWEADPVKVLPTLLLWLHAVMPRFAARSSPLVAYMFPAQYEEAPPPLTSTA
jgi:hypothetical protein